MATSKTPPKGSTGFPGAEICFGPPGQRICIPLTGTGPTFPDPRIAGTIHGSEMRKGMSRYKAAGSDKQRFLKAEVKALCAAGLMSEAEARHIGEIVDLTFKIDENEKGAGDRIREISEQLIDDDASPVAIAIGTIAQDSSATQGAKKGTATADVGAGLVGAGVGAAVGSTAAGVGAVAGGVLGGLIGGLAGSLANEIDD